MTIAQYQDQRKSPSGLPDSHPPEGTTPTRRPASPTRHLTAAQFAKLLACIDAAGGIATVDGIARALPRVRQPVSAVFDLCDADILNVDWESAFDGDMRVWRIDG